MIDYRSVLIAFLFLPFITPTAFADKWDIKAEKLSARPDQLIFKVIRDFGENAVWWDPSSNRPCPMQVDEAIQRVLTLYEVADHQHITHLALLNRNVEVYRDDGIGITSDKFSGYMFWMIRVYDQRLFSLDWPEKNHRDFLVLFDGRIYELFTDGSTRKLAPIDETESSKVPESE